MTDDWYDLLAALLDRQVRFLVVGAHALAVHGVPRGTQDLDVWIDPAPENATLAWQGLAEFGAPLETLGIRRDDLMKPEVVVQFGLPPNRIDIMTAVSGLASFADAWQDRVSATIRGRAIPVLGKEALIANKRAAGRPRDLADIEALGG